MTKAAPASLAIATRKQKDLKGDPWHSVDRYQRANHQSFAKLARARQFGLHVTFISHTERLDAATTGTSVHLTCSIDTHMKTIAVDMDGVLANVFEQYLALDEKHTGKGNCGLEAVKRDSRNGHICACQDVQLLTSGFFRNAPVIQRQSGRSVPSSQVLTFVSSALLWSILIVLPRNTNGSRNTFRFYLRGKGWSSRIQEGFFYSS